jgi:hypothetical protein
MRVIWSQALPNVVFRGATSLLRMTCHSFFDLTLAFKSSMRVTWSLSFYSWESYKTQICFYLLGSLRGLAVTVLALEARGPRFKSLSGRPKNFFLLGLLKLF